MSSTTGRDASDGVITADPELDLINQLPDECLASILSRVGYETLSKTSDFAFLRRTSRDVQQQTNSTVQHPIHCALVCRRWAALVDGSVTQLHFLGKQHPDEYEPMPISLGQSLSRFSSLRSLHFINLGAYGMPAVLQALALGACPLLRSLRHTPHPYSAFSGIDSCQLAGVLRTCLLLQDLNVRVGTYHDENFIVQIFGDSELFLAIRRLCVLESLSLDLHPWPTTADASVLHNVHEGLTYLKSLSISSPSDAHDHLIPVLSAAEALPRLEKFRLSFRHASELPASLSGFSRLRSLDLNLDELSSLPESLSALTSLESLSVSCWKVREIPTWIGSLSALTSLFLGQRQRVGQLTRLHTLPDSLGTLTSLETLTLKQCHNISRLPDTLGLLQRLSVLKISCDRLASVPESIGLLTGLRSLSLKVPWLTQHPAAMWRLSGLDRLVLDCKLDLPEALGDLTALGSLKIRQSLVFSKGKFLQLPEGIGRLTRLQTLMVDTDNVAMLPECLLSLTSLQHVTVSASCLGVRGAHPSLAVLDKLQLQGVSVNRNFGF